MPKGGEVELDYGLRWSTTPLASGGDVILDAAGKIVARNRVAPDAEGLITGSTPARCTLAADAGLCSFVTGMDYRWKRSFKGMKPWFSSKASQWFDPEAFAHPDIETLLKESTSPVEP